MFIHLYSQKLINQMRNRKLLFFAFTAGALFSIYACGGGNSPSTESKQESSNASVTTTKVASPPSQEIMAKGEEVFKRTCIACHQPTGLGIPKTFPPLAKSDFLNNRENVIKQVIKGKTGELVVNGETFNNTMPPQNLSDEEIAAVLSYVYNSFGNSGNAVTTDEVKAIRAKE